EYMKASGMLVKIDDNYNHRIGRCYRCKHIIEPMVMPQWFVKIDALAKPALKAARDGQVKFFPLRFKKEFTDWMENIRDWNISRQIVWGPRIPAWYCLDCHPGIKLNFLTKDKKVVTGLYVDLKDKYSFDEIRSGLQSLSAPVGSIFYVDSPDSCPKCHSKNLLQETDTFDTWFLSGQWPLSTLGYNVADPTKSSPDFAYFYPTSVMDTLWDILFFWVARMMMFGLYLTKEVPFKTIHLHARVVDKNGQKMSKSKANVVDPLSMTAKYGTDALRFSLVYGIAPASDIVVSEDKIRAHRNFVNKIWNAARFIEMLIERQQEKSPLLAPVGSKGDLEGFKDLKGKGDLDPADLAILQKLNSLITSTTKNLNTFHFGQASEDLYQFFWHEFCDVYIESTKNRPAQNEGGVDALPVLVHILLTSLKLLHPFIPFVTETIYQNLKAQLGWTDPFLAAAPWPTVNEI
ncbi:MAG: class I tRNA ligase family protein, partial [Candidatus Shapirobacteria bacterium]